MTVNKETELKFESLANLQFKFLPFENYDTILKKLRTLCSILDICLADESKLKLCDDYYDDDNSSLGNNNCSMRHRIQNGKHKVTLKGDPISDINGSLKRNEKEFDLSESDFKGFITNPVQIRKRFKDEIGVDIICGSVKKILTVQNKRMCLPLKTKASEYNLCIDNYSYFQESTGKYSEIFSEIEIEYLGKEKRGDFQLEKLRKVITNILNYSPTQKSKLERGISYFSGKIDTIATVYSVAFDIVGYSLRSADLQKQLIQSLNYHTKEAIREIRKQEMDENIVCLPTGDGMIIIFEDRPETIVPIVFSVQRRVKKENEIKTFAQFEFRTGLHAGAVFKFSDINDNLNFAGNGINIAQRVMNIGDKWHVISSREGYESFGNIDSQIKVLFKPIGFHEIKHGLNVEIFNVYDQRLNLGNPASPI